MSGLPLDCDGVDDLAGGYALGALDADEAAAVRQHLDGCTRGHPDIAELGAAAAALALAADPVEPAPALRARILAQLDTRARDAATAPAPARRAPDGGGVRAGRWRWAAFALAAVVILALAGTSGLLAQRLQELQAYATAAGQAASLAAQPGSRSASLAPGSGGGPAGTAVIAPDGRGVVLLADLAPVSGSQVYEVWVIAGASAHPVPAGALRPMADGRGWLELGGPPTGVPAGAPLTVAVTREPGPGATQPTLPILASGSAS